MEHNKDSEEEVPGAYESPRPTLRFVAHLPDLITYEDYLEAPGKKKVRLRITMTDEGIEILGDSMYASGLEELLQKASVAEIERMLCG